MDKRYYLESFEAEIASNLTASSMYEGYARDNDCDVQMEEYPTLESAMEALSHCENEYYYNGHGYGWAKEYAVSVYSVDEDGEDVMGLSTYTCRNTNLLEFQKKWEE